MAKNRAMQLEFEAFSVTKKVPLTISRGTTAQTHNVWARINGEGIEGWGEASPFGVGDAAQSTDLILAELERSRPLVASIEPWEIASAEDLLVGERICSAARTAINLAQWDWIGKKAEMPIWKLLGLGRNNLAPTSVTIGIGTPQEAIERLDKWRQETSAASLKIKLGSPEGINADKAMMEAIKREAGEDMALRVDANGGWSLSDAIEMCNWLSGLGVDYVEQPLKRGSEEELIDLKRSTSMPIYIDESCWTKADILAYADRVDGINIKLMKCGGISEALRMVAVAKALGMKIMYGCYSDSSLAISGASQISALADHLDLDSHLNLANDPFDGAPIIDGRITPSERPGLGVMRREN